MMRVLIAPDSFGETLTAVQAAEAMAAGWSAARPSDTVVLAPQSDGGPGFADVISATAGGCDPRACQGRSGRRREKMAKLPADQHPGTTTGALRTRRAPVLVCDEFVSSWSRAPRSGR
ncbi:hypothetical protein GS453_17930 [Rhodococcus hoagii]|uniref:Glycerate kinase n=1 Tax=Rhodococcus hoagii TaxID=43767 RepID=A0AAP2APG0_RHOHA|nr:hypothetical protein [Prescottella equi]